MGSEDGLRTRAEMAAYVDAPELLNTVEADDLLQKLVPVLLQSASECGPLLRVIDGQVPFRLGAW